jgi:nucleotide-binding universal stress UspA family protein
MAWLITKYFITAAVVVLVHALELAPAFAAAGLPDEYELARARTEASVEDWSRPFRELGVECSTVVEEGGPATVLLGAVQSNAADLVVVGRSFSPSFPGMAMGSVAHRALGFAPCPIVLVPDAGG